MTRKKLYDQSLYQFDTLQPSWWEENVAGTRLSYDPLHQDEVCEVAIIGGGYTGLSAAYHMTKDHHIDVQLLEAGEIGWGASGRNGGFCCMGGTQIGVEGLLRKFGLDEARRYYQAQASAVELVRAISRDEAIDFDLQGNCEMVVAEKPSHFADLSKECDMMRSKLGLSCHMVGKEEFAETHYDAPHQHGAQMQEPGFGLHPLKYCLGLAKAAQDHGAKLHAHSEVTDWQKAEDYHLLRTQNGSTLRAKHVIVACNGFMPEQLHKGLQSRVLPLQSQIIVTRPLTDNELAAHQWKTENPAINSRNVYFYYRMLPDKRLMIGGRADFKGTPNGAKLSAKNLHQSMGELWPEWRHVETEFTWRGFVCFTSGLKPSVGRLEDDPSVSFGFGYHGNGVNNATWIGKELADWFAKGNDKHSTIPHHLPAVIRGMNPKFPFAGLRPYYARAGVAWHHLKDKLDFL